MRFTCAACRSTRVFREKSKASHCRKKRLEFQVGLYCDRCSQGCRHALPLLFTKKASYGIIVRNSSAPELSLSDMSKRFCAETPEAKSRRQKQ